MTVGFFGLTGPSGALPDHYSVLMAKCVRLKDSAFREFSDVFNHRLVSLFYRAWEKTRLVPGMERALRRRTGEDLVSWCFSCLVGMGTGGLRGRGAVPDDALVYFGGGFSGSVRNAVSLRRMLSAYFEVPVDVEQFRGRWILLPQGDRSLLPSAAMPRGRQNRLGEDMILGDRCWDAQGAVRLRVGPISREDFLALVPRPIGGAGAEGHMIGPLRDLARSYLGPEMDFDVQVLVPGEEIPDCVLGEEGPAAAVLGWSCWLRAGDLEGVLEDAVFGGSALS
jgi:type VI secretion system protein ImpH